MPIITIGLLLSQAAELDDLVLLISTGLILIALVGFHLAPYVFKSASPSRIDR